MKVAANSILVLLLTLPLWSVAHSATPPKERLESFAQEFESATFVEAPFELSASLIFGFREALLKASATPGLEELTFKTHFSPADFDSLWEELFATPYVIPHFCYALKELDRSDLWEFENENILQICREELKALLQPLITGQYQLRSARIRGSRPGNDFYKVMVIAEDLVQQQALLLNFDVILD